VTVPNTIGTLLRELGKLGGWRLLEDFAIVSDALDEYRTSQDCDATASNYERSLDEVFRQSEGTQSTDPACKGC
jgi:hypothetical protein